MATLDSGRQEKARKYGRISRRLWLVNTLVSGAYTLAWLLLGCGPRVQAWLRSLGPHCQIPGCMAPAFVAIFAGALLIIELPFSYYGGFVLPHRLVNPPRASRAWIADQFKGMLVASPIGLLLLELLYACLRTAGGMWWVWAAAGLLLFNVLAANLAPVLIMPLFNKYVPLGDEHEDLAARLMALARPGRDACAGRVQVRHVPKDEGCERSPDWSRKHPTNCAWRHPDLRISTGRGRDGAGA